MNYVRMKNKLFLSIFFLFISIQCFHGIIPAFSYFDKITQADGLSNNQVQCIFQETAGWMWIGTTQGLNRYDGYNFSVFMDDVDGKGPLRGALIRCIYEDEENNIWVGTERGGLNLFNRELETFSHFIFEDSSIDTIFSVNAITSDRDGKIWLATNKGPAWLNENNQLQLLDIPAMKKLKATNITRLFFDKRNNLWLGTTVGLFFYEFNTELVTEISLPDTRRPMDEVTAMFYDSDNLLWIGTYNSGAYYINTNSKVVKKLVPWVNFDRSETVRAIGEDYQGVMWFGTRGGLIAYDKMSQEFSVSLRDEDESLSLSLNSVLSLCIDSKGDLWVGTRGGINYRDIDKQAFGHIRAAKNDNRFLNNGEVYCFYVNGDDLLIGTESGGINIYNMKTHRFSYVTKKNGLSSDCIKSILKIGDKILVGTFRGGINVLDSKTYQVKKIYRREDGNPHSLRDNRVWCITEDSKKRIWVGHNRGVDLFDIQTEKFERIDTLFNGSSCNWIYEDKDGDLWMGGDEELLIVSPESQKIISYKEVTRGIISTSDNKYWIGTRGHGIALYDKEKGVVNYLTESDGLSNNMIQTIQRDGNGIIWLSTMNGLSRFDEKQVEFVNFDESDGLQENQFNYGAAIKLEGDQLVYGGINGINIFDPLDVRKNYFIPPIVFTGFKIFNKPVEIGTAIEKSINLYPEVKLSYKENVFSFEFAALSYANTKKNQYAYKMEGFDKEWIYSGTANTATYTNLNPGNYLFKVRGSNSNGIWNDEEIAIVIKITPPFWRTFWFGLCIFIVIGMIIAYFLQFFLKRVKLKNELLFEKTKAKKLHEIESLKLRFYTNISHEIRTPLTLILGPMDQVLQNGTIDDESKTKLQLVKKNADQLLKLVNQLLDFRKLEAGKYKINYAKGDLVFFIYSIVESFNPMAAEKEVSLNFSTENKSFDTWFDNDKMQKILNNLLSNALKFTDSKGYVNVSLHILSLKDADNADNQIYKIIVEDSGKGISDKYINKIFDRFVRASNSKDIQGSGIGLSITNEFVRLMGGKIEVESTEGVGSRFIVELPVISDAEMLSVDNHLSENESVIENPNRKAISENRQIILIAEDNSDVREYISSNFKSDYSVLEAENGKEAYEMAIEYIPDLIISDLLMPVMNGSALCKKVKKDERTSHIPFILLTAVMSKETEKEALMAGADDYITKPFDINILKLKVDNLLSLRDALKEKFKNDFILQPTTVTLVSPNEKFLKKAVEAVEKFMDDPDLDIERFASEIGISRMQLYRKIEALTNMTVKEFIRDIRLKRAAQLLEQNKASVSEIVYQVGFRDLAYFRKCFREQYGTSPSDYAAKFKAK